MSAGNGAGLASAATDNEAHKTNDNLGTRLVAANRHRANSGRHRYAERGDDLYETPTVAVDALLRVERLPKVIWEPACGPGSIVSVLRAAGHDVVATDLVNWQCPDSTSRVDFLMEQRAPDGVEAVLTNPPFRLADQFVRHALALVPRVVMLLRLAFLESERRSDVIDGGRLARVHVFRDRLPMMHRHQWAGPRSTSSMGFAWFIWDRKHSGPTVIDRLTAKVRP